MDSPWIKCSDRLPPCNEEVFVLGPSRMVGSLCLYPALRLDCGPYGEEWSYVDQSCCEFLSFSYQPIYWMPRAKGLELLKATELFVEVETR